MKRSWFQKFLILGALLSVGCGENKPPEKKESFDEMRKRLSDKIDQEYASRKSAVSDEARGKLPAKSIEDLVEAYTVAFNAGDFQALEQMTHQENVTDEIKDTMLTLHMSIRSCGTSTIQESSLRPLKDTEQREFWSLKPVSYFECSYRANDDSGSGTNRVPIVMVDDHFYFYVAAPAGE